MSIVDVINKIMLVFTVICFAYLSHEFFMDRSMALAAISCGAAIFTVCLLALGMYDEIA